MFVLFAVHIKQVIYNFIDISKDDIKIITN